MFPVALQWVDILKINNTYANRSISFFIENNKSFIYEKNELKLNLPLLCEFAKASLISSLFF